MRPYSDTALAHIDDYRAYLMSVFDSLPLRVRHALKTCAFGMDTANMPSIAKTVGEHGEYPVLAIFDRMNRDFNRALRHEYTTMRINLK